MERINLFVFTLYINNISVSNGSEKGFIKHMSNIVRDKGTDLGDFWLGSMIVKISSKSATVEESGTCKSNNKYAESVFDPKNSKINFILKMKRINK